MAKGWTFIGRRARVEAERLRGEDGEFWMLCVRRGRFDRLIQMPPDASELEVTRRAVQEAWGERA